LDEQPAARLEPARHPGHHRTAFGQMVQKRANGDEVVWRSRWLVVHDVELTNLQIAAGNPCHQIAMDVGGRDMPGRPDALREPL
jgi:hypothetical protein